MVNLSGRGLTVLLLIVSAAPAAMGAGGLEQGRTSVFEEDRTLTAGPIPELLRARIVLDPHQSVSRGTNPGGGSVSVTTTARQSSLYITRDGHGSAGAVFEALVPFLFHGCDLSLSKVRFIDGLLGANPPAPLRYLVPRDVIKSVLKKLFTDAEFATIDPRDNDDQNALRITRILNQKCVPDPNRRNAAGVAHPGFLVMEVELAFGSYGGGGACCGSSQPKDATLFSAARNENNGANNTLLVKDQIAAVVAFDFTGALVNAGNATLPVAKATLRLFACNVPNDPNFCPDAAHGGGTDLTPNGWPPAGGHNTAFRLDDGFERWGSGLFPLNVPAEGNGNNFPIDNNPRGSGLGVTWNCAVDTNIANQSQDCTGADAWNGGLSHQGLGTDSPTLITNGIADGTPIDFDVTADFNAGVGPVDGTFISWFIRRVSGAGFVAYYSTEGSQAKLGPGNLSLAPTLIIEPSPLPPPIPRLAVPVGLASAGDVGLGFDIKAVIKVNGQVVASGTVPSQIPEDAGPDGAVSVDFPLLDLPDVKLDPSFVLKTGDAISVQISARNACSGSGKSSGTARLLYNQRDASLVLPGAAPFFLADGFVLREDSDFHADVDPILFADAKVGAACSAFRTLGLWKAVAPPAGP